MNLGDVLTEVRRLVQDEDVPYRYDDATLLGYANQTLKRMSLLRPDLFVAYGTVTCAAGVLQQAPADSIRISEVYALSTGEGITEVSREYMDQAHPDWRLDTAGPAKNWMRNVRNPNQFFVHPPAPVGQVIELQYAQTPPDYDDVTPVALLPDAFFPTVVSGTVFLTEAVDNEHVENRRAEFFDKQFVETLTGTANNRYLTDSEMGGMKDEEVI